MFAFQSLHFQSEDLNIVYKMECFQQEGLVIHPRILYDLCPGVESYWFEFPKSEEGFEPTSIICWAGALITVFMGKKG